MRGERVQISPQGSHAHHHFVVRSEEVDVVAMGAMTLGIAALYLPTFWSLLHTIWTNDEQGHGPIILLVSWWLLYQKRRQINATQVDPRPILGGSLIAIGLLLYLFGRSQSVAMFEVGSQIPLLIGLLLSYKGLPALRVAWFPLFFLMFMVPLPGALVASATAPLKAAVSAVAEGALYQLGYPVARTGVMLSVGQYQLLVADACAGLNSMFTLEALGLLYMNLMNYTSVKRNLSLGVLIVPIAFLANVVRVMILVLVTFHLGDEAGQGLIHGFAGLLLFLVALTLMLLTDAVLSRFIKSTPERIRR